MSPPRPSALPPVPGSVTSSPTEPTQVSRGSGYPLLNLEVTVGTRSNAFYDRCATEHTPPREPPGSGGRAGQVGRADSEKSGEPADSLQTSDISEPAESRNRDSVSAGQRPDGGPGRTWTSDFILISNHALTAMQPCVFAGRVRPSGPK